MYFVFCRLYPFSPSHHGSVWFLPVISLLLTNNVTLVRAWLSIWLERFRGSPKRSRLWPLSIQSSLQIVKEIIMKKTDVHICSDQSQLFLWVFYYVGLPNWTQSLSEVPHLANSSAVRPPWQIMSGFTKYTVLCISFSPNQSPSWTVHRR